MEVARKVQHLPTAVLFIFSSLFLFLLVTKNQWKALEMLPSMFDIKFRSSPDSADVHKSAMGFELESVPERTMETKPSGLIFPPPPPVATRHPLEVVYSTDYKFLLNEPNKCQKRSPFLILLVITEPQHFATRQAIRDTWGNESLVPAVSILRLFLTGVHPKFGSVLQNLLEDESSIHRDIIQQDFLDTYNNLTLKTLMGMEWISKFCPNATYVVKADSDIFLNVDYMVSELLQPHLPPKKNYMTGHIWWKAKPVRDKAIKFFVPREVYPNETYPPYCAGSGYVFSGDLATKIYQVAKTIRVINMEDVFVGICLYELGISLTDSPSGLFQTFGLNYDKCKFSKVVVVHHYPPESLLRIWPVLRDQNQTCKS